MWRLWKRRTVRGSGSAGRLVDGDTVLHPEGRRSVEILREVLGEPTRPVPVVRALMTPAAEWRSRGGGRR